MKANLALNTKALYPYASMASMHMISYYYMCYPMHRAMRCH